MADLKQVLKKYGAYIELAAYFIAFISVFLPFKKIVKEERSMDLYKRKDMFGELSNIANEALKYDEKSGNASYIKFTSGVFVLIFTLLSAAVVAVNNFAKNVIENIKNNNKDKANIIEIAFEVIPLAFTFLSFLLTLISTGNGTFGRYMEEEGRKIKLQVGFYFLLLAILVVLAVRSAYLIMIKEYNKLLSNKPIAENRDQNEVSIPVN